MHCFICVFSRLAEMWRIPRNRAAAPLLITHWVKVVNYQDGVVCRQSEHSLRLADQSEDSIRVSCARRPPRRIYWHFNPDISRVSRVKRFITTNKQFMLNFSSVNRIM